MLVVKKRIEGAEYLLVRGAMLLLTAIAFAKLIAMELRSFH